MVLKFFYPSLAVLAVLMPAVGLSQSFPQLKFSNGSVVANHVEEDLARVLRHQDPSDEVWYSVFSIYTKHAYDTGIRQPVQGRYASDGTTLSFTPLFPFPEGETFYAHFQNFFQDTAGSDLPAGTKGTNQSVELTFSVPASKRSRTLIQGVFPNADTLPENVLRMYIYFSSSMNIGEAYEHIHIRDDKGNKLEKPFLIVDQELWDIGRERFTLLFDPGRIKRGIRSNIDLGVPLRTGNVYHLVIDPGWRDGYGNELACGYEKQIFIKDAMRSVLTTDRWEITEPEVGTREPVIIRFDRPLDHALTLKYISVSNALAGTVAGVAALRDDDREWVFVPDDPWAAGRNTLEISPLLEDPAGNNFKNPFDIDLDVSQRVISTDAIRIGFELKEPAN